MIGTVKNISCTLSKDWHEAASPLSDTNVNIMNLILLKYLVPMHIIYYVFHMILTINSDCFPMQHYIVDM